jgi:thiol-disulfide isomerase/thioredoxin
MKRIVTAIATLSLLCLFASEFAPAVQAADAAAKVTTPADRIVVMYFHRTQRCPTCRKMGGYSEEAVKSGFAQEIKARKVEFHFIDFQDEKNEALTKGYQVGAPTLIVAKVVDNKVAEHKNLTEIWEKVGDKDAFAKYVQDNVKEYQKK